MDFKKELKEIGIYIVIGLLLAFTINTGLAYFLGTDKPVMAVVSNSMVPTLNKGDLVIVKGVDTLQIDKGDVIVFYNPFQGVEVVHRVVDIKEKNGKLLFYTKGDNDTTNRLSDQIAGIAPPINDHFIRGRVVLTIPKLGWFRVIISSVV
jgi:signal peptidase I